MAACPQHTFQVLTKRPERMQEWFEWAAPRDGVQFSERVVDATVRFANLSLDPYVDYDWPLPNCWLGVSVENRATLHRLDYLLATPAAVHWVSYEPALEPVCFTPYLGGAFLTEREKQSRSVVGLDWVVIGSESGPRARPFQEDWARSVRDQCQAAGVAFFYKQNTVNGRKIETPELDGRRWKEFPAAAGARP